MSAAQHQAFVLCVISFAAFVFFACLAFSLKGNKFSVFAACNLLFIAGMFGAVALIDLSGERAEVVLAIMTELPVVLIVAWVCLALAGGFSSQFGTVAVEPVARRSALRTVLRSAPVLLLVFVGLAGVIGTLWPSPAMRVYSPAPPEFFALKALIMVPEGFYSGLAASVFLMAGRSSRPQRCLYLKNLAFSLGMSCIAAIALGSTVFAGLRVWAPVENYGAVLETLNKVETCLAIVCVVSFTVGLSLRYTPAVAGPLLHRLQTGWLNAQEQFESLEWRAVRVGAAERLTNASDAVVMACRLQDLSQTDTEKALATIRLLAVMRDPSSETQHITPEAARKLYELQEDILRDDALSSKISWAVNLRSHAKEQQTVKSAPLHDALRAALDLIDTGREGSRFQSRPLWHWIAVAGAADADLIDPSSHIPAGLEDRDEYHAAAEAYRAAKRSLQRLENGG